MYPKQVFSQEWNVKPCRGRQRKTWGKVIDDIFLSLGLDKCERLEDIEREDSSGIVWKAHKAYHDAPSAIIHITLFIKACRDAPSVYYVQLHPMDSEALVCPLLPSHLTTTMSN